MTKTKRFIQYLSENGGPTSLDESLILKGLALGTKNRFNGSYSRLGSQISKVQSALNAAKYAPEVKDKINALTVALSNLVEIHQIQADLLVPIMNLLVANSLFAEDLSKSLSTHFPKSQRR